MLEGGCHAAPVRYRVEGDPVYHAICHCRTAAARPEHRW